MAPDRRRTPSIAQAFIAIVQDAAPIWFSGRKWDPYGQQRCDHADIAEAASRKQSEGPTK